MDLDTYQQTRLTDDGRNCCPRWSPDGRWVAFLKEESLWAVEVGTGERRRIDEGPIRAFAWSPAEDRLAFSGTGGQIAVWEPPQAGIQVLIGSGITLTLGRWAWSPDGEELAYEFMAYKFGRFEWGLGKLSLRGTITAMYASSSELRLPCLAGWSPDGRRLLACTGTPSATAEQDGMPLCWIPAEGGQPQCMEQKVLLHPDWLSWSPTGQLAVIVGEGRETWTNKGLALMDPETLAFRWLTLPTEQAPIQPFFAPDGGSIVYSAGPPTPPAAAYARQESALAQRWIWVLDLGTGQRRMLTQDDRFRDERPFYDATGGHILFVRWDVVQPRASLWLMKADGSAARQVVSELTPLPDPLSRCGHIDWSALWAWWRPDAPAIGSPVISTGSDPNGPHGKLPQPSPTGF
ncbi:MAG: PD40 domain-containing protein [Thermoflexus sp.]|jgi:Tol biopolymer transport system component|nr:PD40 domain-containing protein [Thermoflexus sp.]